MTVWHRPNSSSFFFFLVIFFIIPGIFFPQRVAVANLCQEKRGWSGWAVVGGIWLRRFFAINTRLSERKPTD